MGNKFAAVIVLALTLWAGFYFAPVINKFIAGQSIQTGQGQ